MPANLDPSTWFDEDTIVGQVAKMVLGTDSPLPLGPVQIAARGMTALQAGADRGPSGYASEAINQMLKVLEGPQKAALSLVGTTPEAVGNTGAAGAESIGLPGGVGRFAAGVATDPTTYIGLGLAGRAARGLGAAGAAADNPFIAALQTVDRGDAALSREMGNTMEAGIKLLQSGLVPANQTLGKLFPQLPKWTEYAQRTKAAADAGQWMETRNFLDWDATLNHVNQKTPTELWEKLPETMRQRYSVDDFEALVAAGKKAKATSWSEASEAYAKALRSEMGLKQDSATVKAFNAFTNWWKTQALGSPAYLTGNLAGGLLNNALQGVPVGKTLQDLWDNRGAIWRGEEFDIADAAAMGGRTGSEVPESLNFNARAAGDANVGTSTSWKDGLGVNIGVGAGLGAASATAAGEDPLWGAVAGGAGLGALGTQAHKIRQINQGLETVLRQRAYVKGMGDELVASMDEMEDALMDALAQQRAPRQGRLKKDGTRGPERPGSYPDPAFLESFVEQIRAAGGQVDPNDLMAALMNSARTTDEAALDAAFKLDDILYRAQQAGVNTSKAANFDYEDLSNVERVLRNAFPLSTWFMKAVPMFAEQAARRPILETVPREWNQAAEQHREENGLTGRVAGALPNPIARTLMSTVLGRDVGDVYQNPLANLFPAGDAARGAANLEYADTPVEQILGVLGTMGLSPHPLVDLGSRVLGLQGTDAPAEGIGLRGSGALNALTGVDVAGGGAAIESAVRKGLTGKEPTSLGEVAIARRLDELALRRTGKTISSGDPAVAEYVRAKASQSGPLWAAAQREVEQEKGVQAVGGFLDKNLRGQAVVSPEEQQIRAAGAEQLVPREMSQTLRDLAKSKPTAGAPLPITESVMSAVERIAEQTGRDTPAEVLMRLQDPTNQNLQWIANEIYKWEVEQNPLRQGYQGSGSPEKRAIQAGSAALAVAGQGRVVPEGTPRSEAFKASRALGTADRNAILTSTPMLEEYLAWKKQNPQGDIDAFLAQRR